MSAQKNIIIGTRKNLVEATVHNRILFKLTQGALELFGWFVCEGFLLVGLVLVVALFIYCTYEPFAAHYGWPTFAELMGHSS